MPAAITARPPTTDTYSLPQTQEEFYFALPAPTMDLVLYARNAGWSAEQASRRLGLRPDQVARAYGDIDQKRKSTTYLHRGPLLVEGIPEIESEP